MNEANQPHQDYNELKKRTIIQARSGEGEAAGTVVVEVFDISPKNMTAAGGCGDGGDQPPEPNKIDKMLKTAREVRAGDGDGEDDVEPEDVVPKQTGWGRDCKNCGKAGAYLGRD